MALPTVASRDSGSLFRIVLAMAVAFGAAKGLVSMEDWLNYGFMIVTGVGAWAWTLYNHRKDKKMVLVALGRDDVKTEAKLEEVLPNVVVQAPSKNVPPVVQVKAQY